ncbi:glycosyltransferase family 39 protein [Candidatus Gottesmanbacteria bacterium]|nr:glycosyltransferase family 39 protein [Candidatus Gottesmanbacteria bacterium]
MVYISMDAVIIFFIIISTFFTRVVNLLNIPIFTDEAIYIRWAQIGLADPAHRYIALTDGKQPLLTWLMYPSLKIFSDPLFAGRFVSVLAGVFSAVGIYFVVRKLFGRTEAVFSVLLYIFSPFFLLYDRLALMDSLLTTFGIWSLYLEILLITTLRLDVALLLGVTVGLGVLTKSSAFFYIYLLPVSLLLLDLKIKRKIRHIFKWLGLSIISIFIVQIMYNSLRLSPWFYLIRQKNYSFILTVSEFLKSPFSLFLPNLNGLTDFLFGYLTLPLVIVLGVGLLWGILRLNKKVIFLFIWFLFPFLALAAFGKVLFPRFILFMTFPLIIIIGMTITKLFNYAMKRNKLFILLIFSILIYPFYQSLLLIVNPVNVAIPQNDRNQIFDTWPSGYGVKEVISYLNEQSKNGKIIVGTEGTFGLFPAALEIYLGLNQNIEIKGFWPVSEVPRELLDSASKFPTYLIFKERQEVPSEWPLIAIAKYRRGNGNTFLQFYQVEPLKGNSSLF